jgi:hypothetical protein
MSSPAILKEIIEAKRKSEAAKNELEAKLSQYGMNMNN